MKRWCTVGVLCCMLAPSAAVLADDMGPGTVVGRVTNTSSRFGSRRVFVQAGRRKWALHLTNTSSVYHAGVQVSVHDIDVGSYVKARGRRIGDQRLDVDRLDIAGDRAAFRKSGAYRRDAPEGYFMRR